MVPRENKNNGYVKFWGKIKDYYSIFRSGLLKTALSELGWIEIRSDYLHWSYEGMKKAIVNTDTFKKNIYWGIRALLLSEFAPFLQWYKPVMSLGEGFQNISTKPPSRRRIEPEVFQSYRKLF